MQRLTITIPKLDNDGKSISIEIMYRIDLNLMNLFGGYSRIDIYGQWTDSRGNIYTEESYRYEILTDSHYDVLCDYAEHVKDLLDQESVLCTCETVEVDFI